MRRPPPACVPAAPQHGPRRRGRTRCRRGAKGWLVTAPTPLDRALQRNPVAAWPIPRHARAIRPAWWSRSTSCRCLLHGSCLLSRMVVRKEILNYRAYAGFIEHEKQFVRARRAPKIIDFRDAGIIRTVRNGCRTTGDLLIRRET